MAGKISIRKTRRLRAILAKQYKLPEPPDPKDSFLEHVVMTVLWVGSPPARARVAFVNLAEEFVDWNELRVSVTSEVGAILESCGLPAAKGGVLKRILSRAVEGLYSLDFEALAPRPREQLKPWFVSIEGVPHEVAAAVLYYVYDYDRVLVDAEIARVMHRLGLVAEEVDEAAIEAGLAAVIPARDAHLIYDAFRQHALTVCVKQDFDCAACALGKECETGKQRIAEAAAAAREAKKEARRRRDRERRAAAAKKTEARAAAKPKPKSAGETARRQPKAPAKAARKPRSPRKR